MNKMKFYDEIREKGVITEREVNLVMRRMNNGIAEAYNLILKTGPLKLTPEQTEKGLSWLINKYKTPRGKVRKNNPFSKKQAAILENFKEFQLIGFYNNGALFTNRWLPCYRVWSKHGRRFEYVPTWNSRKEPVKLIDTDIWINSSPVF